MTSFVEAESRFAILVPHTHWDREWYVPFETLRFQLVQFFDQLLDTLEHEPDLPAFTLDGQAVILEDYLEIRPYQRARVRALVTAGRLRPGPFYVQPDEFHISGEALVRNLLVGCQVAGDFGWVMREGYLPDSFGHVHQLPQILLGFGIETFYAMRGFGLQLDQTGSEFWWEAPDGSRVFVEWLTESYSNAAVLVSDPAQLELRHGVLVSYGSLPELLERLAQASHSGVLLLLNGGDHLHVQPNLPAMVRSLDAGVDSDLQLGGLEEFHKLIAQRPPPELVVHGELRYGARHDVFDGIGSTRTPLKAINARTEAHLTAVAERLDAAALLIDGRSSRDALRYAWRELLKNYAHDSICGCSIDEVHTEMEQRFARVGQLATAVAHDALSRIEAAVAPTLPVAEVPVVVFNPSAFTRSGRVTVAVLRDLTAPLGERRFGWTQGQGVDWATYQLLDPNGRPVPFTSAPSTSLAVADVLQRRKELLRDRLSFEAIDVPPLGTLVYRLVPRGTSAQLSNATTTRTERSLQNAHLRVEVEPIGTLALTELTSGRTFRGLFELLDDGDAGDEYGYGYGPVPGDQALSAQSEAWTVEPSADTDDLLVRGSFAVPSSLASERTKRSENMVDMPVVLSLHLAPDSDMLEVEVTIDNRADDHRLRVRFPSGLATTESLAESAFGIVRRDGTLPASDDWRDRPSGVFALRRFVAVQDSAIGLQVLTEGLHEYGCPSSGTVDVTLLRAVGWMARMDHPLRPHKVGPELPTPAAQCRGLNTFRLAIRPYAVAAPIGALFQAAETFTVPLLASAVQGLRAPVRSDVRLGLAVTPVDVVLSAVKTAEDGDGLIVRVFNVSDAPLVATLAPSFQFHDADRCNLEEGSTQPLTREADGLLRLPLEAAQIATIRLRTANNAIGR